MTVCQLPVAVSPDDGCHTAHEQTRSHPVFQQSRTKGQGVAMMGLPKGEFKVGTPKKPEARASVGPELFFPSCPMLPRVSGTGAAEGPGPSAKLLAAPGPALYSMDSCTVQSRQGRGVWEPQASEVTGTEPRTVCPFSSVSLPCLPQDIQIAICKSTNLTKDHKGGPGRTFLSVRSLT